MSKITNIPNISGGKLPHPSVIQIELEKLEQWELDNDLNLRHASGHFFSLIGMMCEMENSCRILINQPEIGLLYTEVKTKNRTIDLESKIVCNVKFEPGNEPYYQLSPTIQKTYSNIRGYHGGKRLGNEEINKLMRGASYVLLQTEQSDSFLHKKNLNVVSHKNIESNGELRSELHIEISIRELLRYLLRDKIVHIDLRSCICVQLIEIQKRDNGSSKEQCDIDKIIKEVSIYTTLNQKKWKSTSVAEIGAYKDGVIKVVNPKTKDLYKVVGVRTTTKGREVTSWDQPLLECPQQTFHLIFNKKDKQVKILVNIYTGGAGSLNEGELSPISTAFGLTLDEVNEIRGKSKEVHQSIQTEEGGRFLKRNNKHILHKIESREMDDVLSIKEGLCWINMDQLYALVTNTNLVSIELRSIACILSAYLLLEK